MEQSFVVDGRQFVLSGVSGTVLSETRRTTTHVSGSVGEAPLIGVHGSIKSHITVDQEIWIRRDDDESDFVIQFPKDIPLLGGQRITAVSLSSNKSSEEWVFLRNESASVNYLFMSSYGFVYNFFKNPFGCLILVGMPIIAMLVLMLTENLLISLAPIVLLVWFVAAGSKKKNRRRALYKDALARVLNDLGVVFTVQ